MDNPHAAAAQPKSCWLVLSHPGAARRVGDHHEVVRPRHLPWACALCPPAALCFRVQVESAMGPALQAAFLVMNHIGGKLLLFQVGRGGPGNQPTCPMLCCWLDTGLWHCCKPAQCPATHTPLLPTRLPLPPALLPRRQRRPAWASGASRRAITLRCTAPTASTACAHPTTPFTSASRQRHPGGLGVWARVAGGIGLQQGTCCKQAGQGMLCCTLLVPTSSLPPPLTWLTCPSLPPSPCPQIPDLRGRVCLWLRLHGPALPGRPAQVHGRPALLLPWVCSGAGRAQAAGGAQVREGRGGVG